MKSMKNIAIFTLAYPPFVGGAEIAVKEITDRLPDLNFRVFSHDFNQYGHGKLAKFFYVFRAWWAAEKLHKEKPFDAVWAIMAAYGGMAALLFKLRHPSVPLLLTLQEGDSEEHILKRVSIFYPLWRLVFKKADYIQCISHYLADFARRHGAIGPIEVVPNGVNLSVYENTKKYKSTKRKKTIITTSRLVQKNGIDTLIEAVKLLNYPVRLEILGDGPQRSALELRAKNLPAGIEINFLGHIDPELIAKRLAEADIFVRPSRSEGLGSSFLEAMAAGLPIIGTVVGGIPDFLQDGETGIFCAVDNPKDLAEKIEILLMNNKLRSRIAANGQKLVWEKYSWDKLSSKMRSIFEKLVTSQSTTKILVATGLYPPEIGGPATYTALVEKELPKRNFIVKVLPFSYVRNYPKILRHIFYFFQSIFQSRGASIIFAQDPVSVGLPAMLAAKITGKKFVIRVAGDYAWEQASQRFGVLDGIDEFQKKKYDWRTELLRKIQKWVVGQADLVITPSKYFRKLVGSWIENPEKVKTIYNGIELGVQNPLAGQAKPKTPDSKLILSAGRLVPWKGFEVLIETMKDFPDWKLVIVGDGPESEKLKAKSEKLEVSDQIEFAGSVPREKLIYYLNKASLFILNTSFESFSFQVVEAMAAGVPVITTNIGNLPEIIENGKEGILVNPNDKVQILSAIRKLDSDIKFRHSIVANAKEKSKEFSIEKTVDNLAQELWSLK